MAETPRITPEMIRLYDEFTHVTLDRRSFMEKLAKLAGGAAAAAAIVPILSSNFAQAAIVAPDDSRIVTERVTFPGTTGEMMGYLARPAGAAGPLASVIVVHENRGLNPHTEDVARRFATEGFLALAVDFMSPVGGTPADENAARERFSQVDPAVAAQNAVAAIAWLKSRPDSNGKVGIVGFCWGGGIVNRTAIATPTLDAGVVFYGGQGDAAQVANIKARMQFHYGGLDERINAGIGPYEAALTAANVDFDSFIYEGANHAFNNDTGAARYSKEASDLAWSRMVPFFRETLA